MAKLATEHEDEIQKQQCITIHAQKENARCVLLQNRKRTMSMAPPLVMGCWTLVRGQKRVERMGFV